MEIYKPRTKPNDLIKLQLLKKRMSLSSKDKQYYQSLMKGYEGEVAFDAYTESLSSEGIILNDLLFNVHNNILQIDSLIITPDKIHLLEIKNYEGDYYYKSDQIFTMSDTEIINPLHQLNRSKYLFSQLLQSLRIKAQVIASVVFVNPHFMLYQAPIEQPYIFPTQIKPYLKEISSKSNHLNETHWKLAEKLRTHHITESQFSRLPEYNFEKLKKGITCRRCNSFSLKIDERYCVCKECGFKELVSEAVVRNVEEYAILFPDKKITVDTIYEWCKIVPAKKRISRILAKNFRKVGEYRWTYYVKDPEKIVD
jgi:DNA-directed RNA polymerase subunit RPC12/RpoP